METEKTLHIAPEGSWNRKEISQRQNLVSIKPEHFQPLVSNNNRKGVSPGSGQDGCTSIRGPTRKVEINDLKNDSYSVSSTDTCRTEKKCNAKLLLSVEK